MANYKFIRLAWDLSYTPTRHQTDHAQRFRRLPVRTHYAVLTETVVYL